MVCGLLETSSNLDSAFKLTIIYAKLRVPKLALCKLSSITSKALLAFPPLHNILENLQTLLSDPNRIFHFSLAHPFLGELGSQVLSSQDLLTLLKPDR